MNHSLSFSYQLAIVLVMVVIGAIAGIYLPWYALGILFGLLAYILRIPTGRAFILGLVSGFYYGLFRRIGWMVNIRVPCLVEWPIYFR